MLKSKVEAILFLTDKPMRAQAIARIVNEDVQVVRQAILDLCHDYEERASGLEIADDNGYIIQVKDEYSSIIDEFVPMEMPVALIRTLSAIAIKQPVPQSEIIKIRGAGAYDHIKELMTRELVIKKEDGRSPLLSTTKKFQEYFRLSQDAKSLRTQLRKEDRVATKDAEGEDADIDGGDNSADAGNSDKAKQLEVLFAKSPDSSLVFRPTDLTGTPPNGIDWSGGSSDPNRRADLSTEAIIDSLTGDDSSDETTNGSSGSDTSSRSGTDNSKRYDETDSSARLNETDSDAHSDDADSSDDN